MANPEHLDLIRKGAAAVAAWKVSHRSEHLDLSEANLEGESLAGLDLSRANLSGACLRRANLTKATLVETNLRSADLTGATFTGALLVCADLSDAILLDAVFDRAYLTGANLTGSRLKGASFRGAALARTVLSASAAEASFRDAILDYTGIGLPFSRFLPSRVLLDFMQLIRTHDFRLVSVIGLYFRLLPSGISLTLEVTNWPMARRFGNLTILTRASYLLLVLVPILAGLWPSVQRVASIDETASTHALEAVAALGRRLDVLALRTSAIEGSVPKELAELKKDIEVAGAAIRVHLAAVGSHVRFPRTLAALFFAALCAALGHLFYELWADSLIKETTADEYSRRAMDEFDDNAKDAHIRLERALHVIAAASVAYPDHVHPSLAEMGGQLVWLPNTAEGFATVPKHLRWVAVGRAAEIVYDNAARQAPLASYCSVSLYLFSALLIVWVVYTQSHEILAAAQLL